VEIIVTVVRELIILLIYAISSAVKLAPVYGTLSSNELSKS